MAPNLFDLLHDKLEIWRLEKRYTRHRNRRSTFVSEAQYVDGEYIYAPTSTYSAQCTGGSSVSQNTTSTTATAATKESKASRRMSRMGLEKLDWRKGAVSGREANRTSRVSVMEVHWDGSVR